MSLSNSRNTLRSAALIYIIDNSRYVRYLFRLSMTMLVRTSLALLLVVIGAAIFAVVLKASGLTFSPDPEIGPAEFISIILTALAVIIAAVTLLIGALAIYGWIAFEARVTQASETFLEKRFSSEDPRYGRLIEDLKEDVRLQLFLSSKPEQEQENIPNNDNPDAQ